MRCAVAQPREGIANSHQSQTGFIAPTYTPETVHCWKRIKDTSHNVSKAH